MTALIIDRIHETDDATIIEVSTMDLTYDTINLEEGYIAVGPLLFSGSSPFTRSNGSISARIYERLTKASRRAERDVWGSIGAAEGVQERYYREGVYDTLAALQEELT